MPRQSKKADGYVYIVPDRPYFSHLSPPVPQRQ